MARSIQTIRRAMAEAFMADPILRDRYGFQDGDTFDRRFSLVSLERILIYIVASAHHVLERIFDAFRDDVMRQINSSVVATIPWYHSQALSYQHGDALKLCGETLQWRYPMIDPSKRIVRYAAVKDHGGSIQVLVAKEAGGLPTPLSEDELRSFKAYMASIKIAGVVLSVRSLPADILSIAASVQLDPLVYLPNGVRIQDGTSPVEDAIRSYLRGITFGGTFNKTRLVDAIQAVEGVIDVEIGVCTATPHGDSPRPITGNNYTSRSGCFISPELAKTVQYTYG